MIFIGSGEKRRKFCSFVDSSVRISKELASDTWVCV